MHDITTFEKRRELFLKFVACSEICRDYDAVRDNTKKLNLMSSETFIGAVNYSLTWKRTFSGYLSCAYINARWIIFLMENYPSLTSEKLYREDLDEALSRLSYEIYSQEMKSKKYENFLAYVKSKYKIKTSW